CAREIRGWRFDVW
nr:immunoglobulin heavy chain junction region [Macaca mulatta]